VGRRVLAALPATNNEQSHIHHIVTVISIMGARVRFMWTVSVNFELETRGYQLKRLITVDPRLR
jgi:hypothetical protein